MKRIKNNYNEYLVRVITISCISVCRMIYEEPIMVMVNPTSIRLFSTFTLKDLDIDTIKNYINYDNYNYMVERSSALCLFPRQNGKHFSVDLRTNNLILDYRDDINDGCFMINGLLLDQLSDQIFYENITNKIFNIKDVFQAYVDLKHFRHYK